MALPWLEAAAAAESHQWVRYAMDESARCCGSLPRTRRRRLRLQTKLGEIRSQNAVPALKELVQAAAEEQMGPSAEDGRECGRCRHRSNRNLERVVDAIETVFRGISLSSILLIMSVGLAIVFGLMGVINMAHGELMMIGAYATFMIRNVLSSISLLLFESYYLAALPAAFLCRGTIRVAARSHSDPIPVWTPLETMLATWGVSLVLIQAARIYFGDLTSVSAPAWLSGGTQVMVGCVSAVQSLFIIGLSHLRVRDLLVLFRSKLGLRVRAVTQNRNMSACLGIPPER